VAELPILGWKEEADLPEWGIAGLRVKFDTGARTSAIHARRIEETGAHVHGPQQLPVLRLEIPLSRIHPERFVVVEAPVVGYKSVKDTGARSQRRPVVRTRFVCGPVDREIDVTVTDRTGMIFRMIVGRHAIAGAAVIDPALGYTLRESAPRRGGRRIRRPRKDIG
jgi:hypothetical protein